MELLDEWFPKLVGYNDEAIRFSAIDDRGRMRQDVFGQKIMSKLSSLLRCPFVWSGVGFKCLSDFFAEGVRFLGAGYTYSGQQRLVRSGSVYIGR